MILRAALSFAAAVLAAGPVAAQDAGGIGADEWVRGGDVDTDRQGSDDIVVVGDDGDAFRLTGDALRDALRAFRRHRPTYAPAGRLFFLVEAADGGTLSNVAVYLRARRRLRDGSRAIVDLPLGDGNRFELPVTALDLGDFDLRVSGARGGIRIRPQVLSPGTSIADRRFGDLRLQCRTYLAFARLSVPMRLLAGAVGPCGSSRVALYTRGLRPVAAVAITGYDRPFDIRPDGSSFRVPLADTSIANDARLRLTYR